MDGRVIVEYVRTHGHDKYMMGYINKVDFHQLHQMLPSTVVGIYCSTLRETFLSISEGTAAETASAALSACIPSRHVIALNSRRDTPHTGALTGQLSCRSLCPRSLPLPLSLYFSMLCYSVPLMVNFFW